MTINQLIHFLEIVKYQNFTKAAENLYISQPAISKSIQSLERDLNVQLIDRSSKKFKLTNEGKILNERGRISMEIINNQMDYLYDSVNARKGELIVGVPPVIGTACFAAAIPEFHKLYPDVKVKLVEEGAQNIMDKVVDGDVDLGAVILPINRENVFVTPFISSENVLIVHESHPLAKRHEVSFSELKNETFLSLDKTYMLPRCVRNICQELGFQPNVVMESSQWDFILEMVAGNQGIAILPKLILERVRTPKVRQLRLVNPTFPWRVVLIVHRNKTVIGPIKLFIDFMKEYGTEFEKRLQS